MLKLKAKTSTTLDETIKEEIKKAEIEMNIG